MINWGHHFWSLIVTSGFLGAILGIAVLGTGLLQFLNILLRQITTGKSFTNSILDKIDLFIFVASDKCSKFFWKMFRWFGSLIIVFMIVGCVGQVTIFLIVHWKEIWRG